MVRIAPGGRGREAYWNVYVFLGDFGAILVEAAVPSSPKWTALG